MTQIKDFVPGRGDWMHTSLGGRFYPGTPRASEVFISDIANGLALDCRYAGQGGVNRYYSVAEHSALMANYFLQHNEPEIAYVALLHDASEAYLNDLAQAVKRTLGQPYRDLEDRVQNAIWHKFHLADAAKRHHAVVKDLDKRMVPLEKRAIMRHPQPWAADTLEAPEGIFIQCLEPPAAKEFFANVYWAICRKRGIEPETIEF